MAYPLDIDLERERLARRRKVAEALLAQSQTPMGGTETVGGIAVRRSPLEGIAKLAQAGAARKSMDEVDQEERALGGQLRTDTANAISDYTRKVTPRAAVASALTEDASGNAYNTDAQPAYAPGMQEKRSAAYDLMGKLGSDPRDVAKLIVANALKGGDFAKVDPKDYTPESLAAYQSSNDPSVLRPRVKTEFVNGQAVDPYATKPGTVVPQPPTEIERELVAAGLTKGTPEWNKAMSARVDKQTTHQPPVDVNVSTEKKYGEAFAGKIADADVAMRDAAMKAPDLAERSNRVLSTLAGGKVITGAGADVRLQLGKALNLAGASDAQTVANTEALATDLAKNTLDAIKQSGLGAGNGFSNADRDFLEKAVGGKITLEAETIKRLASLAHRAAEKSAEAWSKRVKDIPDEALEGAGVKRDAISVPAIFGGSAAPSVSPETQRLLDKYAPVTP